MLAGLAKKSQSLKSASTGQRRYASSNKFSLDAESVEGLGRMREPVLNAHELPTAAQQRSLVKQPKSIKVAKPLNLPDMKSVIVPQQTLVVPKSAMKDKGAGSEAAPHAILCYWPRDECNGKGTGHISLYFPGQQYFSFIKLKGSTGYRIGKSRTDVPGFVGAEIVTMRHPIDPARVFEDDVGTFGPLHYALVLPKAFTLERLWQQARGILCRTDEDIRMPGPLPYYQLFDSETEQGGVVTRAQDRQQCASTVAHCLSQSLSLDFQQFVKPVGEQYLPRDLTRVVVDVSAAMPENDQWSPEAFPFALPESGTPNE